MSYFWNDEPRGECFVCIEKIFRQNNERMWIEKNKAGENDFIFACFMVKFQRENIVDVYKEIILLNV